MNSLSSQNNRPVSSCYGDSDSYNGNRFPLGSFKAELVQKLSSEFSDVDSLLVSQAVNEAQALAAQTLVPQLVLPVLAEEKVQALQKWSAKQQQLLHRRALAFAA
jgi:hypothetical protein